MSLPDIPKLPSNPLGDVPQNPLRSLVIGGSGAGNRKRYTLGPRPPIRPLRIAERQRSAQVSQPVVINTAAKPKKTSVVQNVAEARQERAAARRIEQANRRAAKREAREDARTLRDEIARRGGATEAARQHMERSPDTGELQPIPQQPYRTPRDRPIVRGQPAEPGSEEEQDALRLLRILVGRAEDRQFRGRMSDEEREAKEQAIRSAGQANADLSAEAAQEQPMPKPPEEAASAFAADHADIRQSVEGMGGYEADREAFVRQQVADFEAKHGVNIGDMPPARQEELLRTFRDDYDIRHGKKP